MPIGDLPIGTPELGVNTLTDAQPDGSASVRYRILEDGNMSFRGITIPVPLEVAAGNPVQVGDMTAIWVQWHSADNVDATVQLQGAITHDDSVPTVWTNIGSAVAAAGVPFNSLLEVPQAVNFLRCNTTAYASGTPKATAGSRYTR